MYISLKITTVILTYFQMAFLILAPVMLSILLYLLEEKDEEMEENEGFLSNSFYTYLITWVIVRIFAMIAISWGIAKSKHTFYMPWLIMGSFEIFMQWVYFFKLFLYFAAWDVIKAFLRIMFNVVVFLCVYTMYKRDKARQTQEIHRD